MPEALTVAQLMSANQQLQQALAAALAANRELSLRADQHAQAYEQLRQQLHTLLRQRFGQRSERFVDPASPQLDMFSQAALPPASPPAEPESLPVKAHQRTKKPRDLSRLGRSSSDCNNLPSCKIR